MQQSVRDLGPHLQRFEASCFNGQYITGHVSAEYLDRIERSRLGVDESTEEPVRKSQMSLQFNAARE
jgi:amidophosphoribosyltransferase